MRWEDVCAVYLLTNRPRGVLYVGVTSNLIGRVLQHREGAFEGFTAKYQLKRLVWHRPYGDIRDAIDFEKRLKRWRRQWKFELVEAENPEWIDLWPELTGADIIGPLSHLQGR
jgi:putative endonuclease